MSFSGYSLSEAELGVAVGLMELFPLTLPGLLTAAAVEVEEDEDLDVDVDGPTLWDGCRILGLVTLPELISIMETMLVESSGDLGARATPLRGDSIDTVVVAVPDGVGGGSLGEEGEAEISRCQSGLSAS